MKIKKTLKEIAKGILIASATVLPFALAISVYKNDPIIRMNSQELWKQDKVQIYRWADSWGDNDGIIEREEYRAFVRTVMKLGHYELSKPLEEWTSQEVDNFHQKYFAFCKNKGR